MWYNLVRAWTRGRIIYMIFMIKVVNALFRIYSYLIIARIFLSWIPVDHYNPVVQFIYKVTEPILAPFRSILRIGGTGFDLSPIIVFFLLNLLQRGLINLLINLSL